MFNSEMISLVGVAFWESIYMTIISSFFAYVIGLPLGLILVATDKDGIAPAPLFNQVLGIIINILRSIPFLILLVAMMPITQAVVGTVIGAKATVVVLVVAAAPFIARLVESSLKEVDKGVVEAAQSMGASPFEIMTKVLLPEAKPSLLIGSAIAMNHPGLLRNGRFLRRRRSGCHCHQLWLLPQPERYHVSHGSSAGSHRAGIAGSWPAYRKRYRQTAVTR